MRSNIHFILIAVLAGLALGQCLQAAEPVRRDTLSFRILFRTGKGSVVDLSYENNGYHLSAFERELDALRRKGGRVSAMLVRASSSPEGGRAVNLRLSEERGRAVADYMLGRYGLDADIITVETAGEDWRGLREIVSQMDRPWRDEVLSLVGGITPLTPYREVFRTKMRLQQLDEGQVWMELVRDVFPALRAACCDTYVVVESPLKEKEEMTGVGSAVSSTLLSIFSVAAGMSTATPVYVHDTVYVEVPAMRRTKSTYDLSDRRMWFAPRTNFLMGPLTNVGLEIPLGKHFSIGGDWYSPWLWRPLHRANRDSKGWCFEFQAADVELRYWFGRRRDQASQRLLGFAIGVYGAAGHYDFERNWFGYQGDFWNAGVDLVYAVPLWGGRMHMEFELGVGYIHSLATPYECLEPGGECFKLMDTRKLVRWIGPTRAQVSLVVPVYFKTKKGGAR